jgi:hypothetical protein
MGCIKDIEEQRLDLCSCGYTSIRCFNICDIRLCSMFSHFTNMLERKGIEYCKYQSSKHAMPFRLRKAPTQEGETTCGLHSTSSFPDNNPMYFKKKEL